MSDMYENNLDCHVTHTAMSYLDAHATGHRTCPVYIHVIFTAVGVLDAHLCVYI